MDPIDPISSKRRYAAGLMKKMSDGVSSDLRKKYRSPKDDARERMVDEEGMEPAAADAKLADVVATPDDDMIASMRHQQPTMRHQHALPKPPPAADTPSSGPPQMIHPDDEEALSNALAALDAKRGQ